MLANNWKGLETLDEDIAAPMFGFKDKFAYYAAGSPAGRLHQIKCPVLAFHAADDWVSPEQNVPDKEISSEGSNVAVLISK